MKEPLIIQGGMGVAVSNWKLAKAVSMTGQLGVVSGTAVEAVLARRLQMGDPDGAMRRALEHFPNQEIAVRILEKYFITGGKPPHEPYKNVPMFSLNPPKELLELTVAGNFVEVYLAKEGHAGIVGVNYLEKIQLPTLASIYGALLAGVDYVLMGAGIPRAIPAILDQLAAHQKVELKINVHGATAEDNFHITFNPKDILPNSEIPLKRPKFIAIVSSEVLAITLAKKSSGHVDGFVIENPTAGGHNAPPRGALQLSDKGEPIYGVKDKVDLAPFRKLGLPFWLAGSCADPLKLKEALAEGAAGIQAGTVFAYCEESGLMESIKRKVLGKVIRGEEEVFTDPLASPTGFPFKIVRLGGTNSEQKQYEARPRLCDLGYLRTAFKRHDGTVGYRCPGEPKETYLQKEGKEEDTPGRKCICNGLMAGIGLAQEQKNYYQEKPLVTSGDDLPRIALFLKGNKFSYSAHDVIRYLLSNLSVGLNPIAV
ncbi:MAG TPA: nitronate monooxygenase [bacterium]|jgi:nitronate monooxygenase|nr:nitronate monooxygenase [bacterium]